MTILKKGDKVRRTRPHSRLNTTQEYTVAYSNGHSITLEEVPGKAFSPARFTLLTPSASAIPEPAEEGIFVCVDIAKLEGNVVTITGPQFKYWVDAERECERASKFLPNRTFGVLKLIGEVSMKPSWKR